MTDGTPNGAHKGARRDPNTAADALPFKACPKCGGKIHIDVYRPAGHAAIWDADCMNCSTTVAQWLPGQDSWTPLYDQDGKRIPNPQQVVGYGEEGEEAKRSHG